MTPAQAEQTLVTGRKLYQQQPRTLERVQRAVEHLGHAARALPDRYDAQWQAAEALAFLAEHEPRPADRIAAARAGIVLARRGRELQPDGAQAHYWYAINTGLLADVDRSFGLSAINEMEPALKRAAELDERYDYAGAHRLLGILYLRTPPPPASIGSSRKGLKALQRAAELFPDYPENQLYLAEAYRETGQPEQARPLLAKVAAAKPWPDRVFESGAWRKRAEQLLAKDKLK
jgi:hypothetical protein